MEEWLCIHSRVCCCTCGVMPALPLSPAPSHAHSRMLTFLLPLRRCVAGACLPEERLPLLHKMQVTFADDLGDE